MYYNRKVRRQLPVIARPSSYTFVPLASTYKGPIINLELFVTPSNSDLAPIHAEGPWVRQFTYIHRGEVRADSLRLIGITRQPGKTLTMRKVGVCIGGNFCRLSMLLVRI